MNLQIFTCPCQRFPDILHFPRSGSWRRPFGVTWRNRSCDHLRRPHQPFPIGAPFLTKCLCPSVFEILIFKRNLVTTLTFQGHVMSSVTCPLESPCAISYWCSFERNINRKWHILWSKVSIFNRFQDIWLHVACPVQIVIVHARYQSRDLYPMQNLGTYLNLSQQIVPSLWHFYCAPMKNSGVYTWDHQWRTNR